VNVKVASRADVRVGGPLWITVATGTTGLPSSILTWALLLQAVAEPPQLVLNSSL
jgi:hypothetical protein